MHELTKALTELWERHIEGKISESQMRRSMLKLLEAQTENTAAENRKAISGFVKTAKARRDLNKSFRALR